MMTESIVGPSWLRHGVGEKEKKEEEEVFGAKNKKMEALLNSLELLMRIRLEDVFSKKGEVLNAIHVQDSCSLNRQIHLYLSVSVGINVHFDAR